MRPTISVAVGQEVKAGDKLAVIEAMAAGLPVIASDVGGTADIIEPGQNGLIVPGGDQRALRIVREANELVSRAAGLAFPIRNGVPVMLRDEARDIGATK